MKYDGFYHILFVQQKHIAKVKQGQVLALHGGPEHARDLQGGYEHI